MSLFNKIKPGMPQGSVLGLYTSETFVAILAENTAVMAYHKDL